MAGTKETDCTDFEARNTSDETVCTVTDEYIEYRLNGKLHREGGPALESLKNVHIEGTHKEWHRHGELHREDGPAIELASGSKVWYKHGKLHREDGPAVQFAGMRDRWYLNGAQLTKEQHTSLQSDSIDDDDDIITINDRRFQLVPLD